MLKTPNFCGGAAAGRFLNDSVPLRLSCQPGPERRSEPPPPGHQPSGPLVAESHPVLPGPGVLAHGLQRKAAWGPFPDASPGPHSLAVAAMCPGRTGRLPPADLRAPGFSGLISKSPSPTGLSIPVSGSPGPWPPMAPLRPANPPGASAAVPPRAWLPGMGSEPGPGFGQTWQRVHVCAGSAWVPELGAVGAATESRPGLRTVARGGARANSRSAAAGRAQADTGKACDWPSVSPMQTS